MPKKPTFEEFTDSIERGLKSYERISPTAWTVAYRRIFMGIPYAREIFKGFEEVRRKLNEPNLPDDLKKIGITTPQLEARYRLVDLLIKNYGTDQILEIASGLSPRGLIMSRNKSINFVEVDLKEIIDLKIAIVKRIKRPNRNLVLITGNALKFNSLKKAVANFNPKKPITIVNEGLLRYLNFNEKKIVAQNIHSLLQYFGGVWINPDITLKKCMDIEDKGRSDRIQKLTGINVESNRFRSTKEARKFFESLGFTIKVHSFTEVEQDLVSPNKFNISSDKVHERLKPEVAFVMKIKNTTIKYKSKKSNY